VKLSVLRSYGSLVVILLGYSQFTSVILPDFGVHRRIFDADQNSNSSTFNDAQPTSRRPPSLRRHVKLRTMLKRVPDLQKFIKAGWRYDNRGSFDGLSFAGVSGMNLLVI
jgi:hypothetical protein